MTVATTESVAAGVAVEPGKVLDYLGLNPADPKAQAVVAVAQRYDLDPLLKHVIVIPRGGVYVTRDGLLHVAHRSGQLDGIVVEQEPTLSEDGKEWVARVSVYRKDMRHPFTFPGRYPVNGGNREYAQEMALKAAEAHALRRAFDVTGLPVLDEQRGPVDREPADTSSGLARALGQDEEPAEGQLADDEQAASESPLLNTSSRLAKAMYASINEHGVPEDERLVWIGNVIGREIGSSKEMTEAEAREVLDFIGAQKAEQ